MATELKRMKIREISSVDEPASPGCYIILAKSRHGERQVAFSPVLMQGFETFSKAEPDAVGAAARRRFAMRRRRRNVVKAAPPSDAEITAVANQALQHPPLGSEPFDAWTRRIFGAQRGALTAFELKLVNYVFELSHRAAAVKTTAAETMNQLAKSRAAETGKPFESCYADVAKTPIGNELYSLMSKRIALPVAPDTIAKRAADELDVIAKRIASDEHLSPAQAFSQAAQRFPDLYGKARHGR